MAFLNNIGTHRITIEEAKNLQEDFNDFLKEIRKSKDWKKKVNP